MWFISYLKNLFNSIIFTYKNRQISEIILCREHLGFERLFETRRYFKNGGEQVIEIVVLIIGVLIGISICYIYLKERLAVQFERWKTKFEEQVRQEVLERSRAVLKGKIGEQLAPLLPMFKHEPADARFLGSPVDYVVFDGYAEGDPRSITFVDVKTGKTAALTSIEQKLKLIIEQGKVKWETIHVGILKE